MLDWLIFFMLFIAYIFLLFRFYRSVGQNLNTDQYCFEHVQLLLETQIFTIIYLYICSVSQFLTCLHVSSQHLTSPEAAFGAMQPEGCNGSTSFRTISVRLWRCCRMCAIRNCSLLLCSMNTFKKGTVTSVVNNGWEIAPVVCIPHCNVGVPVSKWTAFSAGFTQRQSKSRIRATHY